MVTTTRPYRSSRRTTQARETRRRVLAAATSAFLDHGYAGTTMRAVAARAQVSVPTVELLFGTKARLLKEAIDVAIVGDDEPVPVLDRSWTADALAARTVDELLAIVAGVFAAAQARSAGLVLAVFEGSSTDAELAELAARMTSRRATTAAWVVDAVRRLAPLRAGCTRQDAIDTVWMLVDSAVFDRLTRQLHWTVERYERWLGQSIRHVLVADAATTSAHTAIARTAPTVRTVPTAPTARITRSST